MRCKLRVLMAQQNPPLTQKALMEATGLGSHTVSRLANNSFTQVNRSTVETLVNYFNCDIADLFEVKR